jgi:hypothetical protein
MKTYSLIVFLFVVVHCVIYYWSLTRGGVYPALIFFALFVFMLIALVVNTACACLVYKTYRRKALVPLAVSIFGAAMLWGVIPPLAWRYHVVRFSALRDRYDKIIAEQCATLDTVHAGINNTNGVHVTVFVDETTHAIYTQFITAQLFPLAHVGYLHTSDTNNNLNVEMIRSWPKRRLLDQQWYLVAD